MNRREFLTNLGLGSILTLSTQKVLSQENPSEEICEDILQKLNQTNYCSGSFVLVSQYDPEPEKSNNSLIPVCPKFKNEIQVILKPGPDGNLYFQYNGQWKKILTN